MAITYSLEIGAAVPVRRVADELRGVAQRFGLMSTSTTTDELLEPGATTALGTRVRVVDGSPWQPSNAVVDDLGFVPTVRVSFRRDKVSDPVDQDDDMIRLVDGLLDRIAGDAVLHSGHGEQIWLLRRDGDLSVNERTDMWPPARLALLTQPYRRATHTFA